jgi:hypothetical protein
MKLPYPSLFQKRGENLIQIALSSFGSSSCQKGQPTVFTRLNGEVVEWIKEEALEMKEVDRKQR